MQTNFTAIVKDIFSQNIGRGHCKAERGLIQESAQVRNRWRNRFQN